MWYDFQWDNSSEETKVTQKLKTKGYRPTFNNEQMPIRIYIVSYKSLFCCAEYILPHPQTVGQRMLKLQLLFTLEIFRLPLQDSLP